MNTEAQIWELFYAGLTPNAMFMVAMVLLTWLGFRFAAAISNDSNTPLMAKILSSAYFVIIAMMFYSVAEIGGIMASAAADSFAMLPEMSSRAQAFIERVEAGQIPGGPLSVALIVVILFMQLTMTWMKKA
jgi:hypothetical protein